MFYLACMVSILAFGHPESVVSTGVHQSYGPCDERAVDLFGYTRGAYLCREEFAEDFNFYCLDQSLPPAEPSWFTLCGSAHIDYVRYVTTSLVVALTAAFGLGCMLLAGGADPAEKQKASRTQPNKMAREKKQKKR